MWQRASEPNASVRRCVAKVSRKIHGSKLNTTFGFALHRRPIDRLPPTCSNKAFALWSGHRSSQTPPLIAMVSQPKAAAIGDKVEAGRQTDIIQEARICLLAGARVANSADPADALVVLLSGPLSEQHGEVFSSTRLAELTNSHFGWQLSSDTIDFFVPKMRGLGWLDSRSNYPARGPFYVNLPEPDVGPDETFSTREALSDLGAQFLQFARELSPLTTLPDNPEEAGATLLRYVVDANLPALANAQQGANDVQFLSARFVEHVNRKKLDITRTIASLSAVGFLLRVADEVGKPNKKRPVDLRIVADGPVILDYMGCSGDLREGPTKDLFGRLRKRGASIVTFQHCVNEARDALASVLRTTPRDRHGPTGDALRKGLVNENVLLAMLQAFDVSVRAAGIEILPDNIKFMPQAKQFFDDERAGELEKIVNWHDSDNDNAKYADSDTAIFTLRRRASHRTSDLFTSKIVCVTSNDRFAGSVKRFLIEIAYYNARQVPPIVTLRELSAKLWIDIGSTDAAARLDLPNSQLLYACDKALRFNRKVVERAREELKKVKPEQLKQFELLLEVPRSARAVMDLTLNDERNVTSGNVDQLLEAAISAAGEEVGEKAKEQRRRDSELHKKQLAEIESDLDTERQRAVSAEERANATEVERLRGEVRGREIDQEMLNAAAERATTRFRNARTVIRASSVFLALVPLVTAAVLLVTGNGLTITFIIGAVGALLAAGAAMDRPGAWLSGLIQRHIGDWAEGQLRAAGRHDLATRLVLCWSGGEAHAQAEDLHLS